LGQAGWLLNVGQIAFKGAPLEDRWGEIAQYPDLIDEYADRMIGMVQRAWADHQTFQRVIGTSVCLSCLLEGGRYDELRELLAAHGGREIKHTGDGIMASFDNVANSVRAAADIQRRFAAYNAGASETLSVRIGIDAGEPVEDHSDLFGSTVQLAARLCSEAEANGIIVSGFARELCNEDAARFVALGERRLKGFADKAQVFRFECGTESPSRWRGPDVVARLSRYLRCGRTGCRPPRGGRAHEPRDDDRNLDCPRYRDDRQRRSCRLPVHEWLGMRFISKSWLNLEVVWAQSK
jgi:hypothetical protein